MLPNDAITMLDQQIMRHGETVLLWRAGIGEKAVRGIVRSLPTQIIANAANERRSAIVLSPSDFADWPSLPNEQDKVAIGAGAFTEILEPVELRSIDDQPVRISIVVAS